MVRTMRWVAGAIFGVSLAALVPFLIEKGAEPRGDAVLWILYGLLGVSASVWLAVSVLSYRTRPEPLEVFYTLDDNHTLDVLLRREHPQIILLCLAIRNPNLTNLDGVAVNSLVPQGLRAVHCGVHGEPIDKGRWLTTLEPLPDDPGSEVFKDCWVDDNLSLAGNGLKLFCFKLRISRPGVYFVKALLFGNVKKQEHVARLEVSVSEKRTLGGAIGELIYEGEDLAGERVERHGIDYEMWMEKLAEVVGSLSEGDERWWSDVVAGLPERGRHLAQRRVAVSKRIGPLYDLRRRLEHPADPIKRSFGGGGGIHKHG